MNERVRVRCSDELGRGYSDSLIDTSDDGTNHRVNGISVPAAAEANMMVRRTGSVVIPIEVFSCVSGPIAAKSSSAEPTVNSTSQCRCNHSRACERSSLGRNTAGIWLSNRSAGNADATSVLRARKLRHASPPKVKGPRISKRVVGRMAASNDSTQAAEIFCVPGPTHATTLSFDSLKIRRPNVPALQRRGPRGDVVKDPGRGSAAGHVRCKRLLGGDVLGRLATARRLGSKRFIARCTNSGAPTLALHRAEAHS